MKLRDEIEALAGRPGPLSVTLVRPGALGDTILLLPAVALLRTALQGLKLTLLGSLWAAHLAPLMPCPWETEDFGDYRLVGLFSEGSSDAPPPFLRDADLTVVYTDAPDGAFVTNLTRMSVRGRVLTWPVHPPAGCHAAAHMAGALAACLPSLDELPGPELRAPASVAERALEWARERLPGDGPLVCVHPGGGVPRKCWPPDRYAGLIEALVALGTRPVLTEGPADRARCAATLECLPGHLRPPVAKPDSVEDLAALIAQADLHVGNDSGPSHLAAALGVPTLAVFGSTDPAQWRPLGPNACVVHATQPGGQDPWPSVEQVLEAATRLLEG